MSVSALLALLSGQMLAFLFASYNVSLLVLLRAFYLFSSALFHDCLALSFWLSVPIIARMGSLFYVTISVDSVLLSFPKLVKIHNVIWLGISKFCSSWIYCWAEIYRKQIIHGWLWPRRAYHPLAIANILIIF